MYVEEIIKIAGSFYKNKLNKQVNEMEKSLECVVVKITFGSLLPRKSKFTLKKLWVLNFVILSIKYFFPLHFSQFFINLRMGFFYYLYSFYFNSQKLEKRKSSHWKSTFFETIDWAHSWE